MAFLEISALRKRYRRLEVLKGIDLELEKGGFLVLVGPSGCGKSTLLGTIAGLETISAGEIRIDGAVVNDIHPSKRDIAMVFQSFALLPWLTAGRNVELPLRLAGVGRTQRRERARELLTLEGHAAADVPQANIANAHQRAPILTRWLTQPAYSEGVGGSIDVCCDATAFESCYRPESPAWEHISSAPGRRSPSWSVKPGPGTTLSSWPNTRHGRCTTSTISAAPSSCSPNSAA